MTLRSSVLAMPAARRPRSFISARLRKRLAEILAEVVLESEEIRMLLEPSEVDFGHVSFRPGHMVIWLDALRTAEQQRRLGAIARMKPLSERVAGS